MPTKFLRFLTVPRLTGGTGFAWGCAVGARNAAHAEQRRIKALRSRIELMENLQRFFAMGSCATWKPFCDWCAAMRGQDPHRHFYTEETFIVKDGCFELRLKRKGQRRWPLPCDCGFVLRDGRFGRMVILLRGQRGTRSRLR